MARYTNGLNGPITGKAGAVIGSSRRGTSYLKGSYKQRTKRVSRKEKANRNKFATAQFWLQPLRDFVRLGFKDYSPKAEGFNAAMSHILLNSFEGSTPDLYINPARVKLSHGTLPLPENMSVSQVAPSQFRFSWDFAKTDDSNPHDQVMMVAYDPEKKEAFMSLTGQFRSTGEDILEVYYNKPGKFHLYAAFLAADRNSQSDSVYLGEWMVK